MATRCAQPARTCQPLCEALGWWQPHSWIWRWRGVLVVDEPKPLSAYLLS